MQLTQIRRVEENEVPDREYFMSEEQEKQAQAMTLLRLAEAKKKLATLKAEAQRIGKALSELAQGLIGGSSESMSADIEGNQLHFVRRGPFNQGIARGAVTLDAARIKTLVDDINKTSDEAAQLQQQVRAMGLDV